MPNGARHAIGVVAGLVLTPVLAAGLMLGTDRFARTFTALRPGGPDRWVGGGVLLVVAVLLGVLAGSRTSPLASLIPGLVYAGTGGLWVIAPTFAGQHTAGRLPGTLDRGYTVIGPYGVLLLIGVLLLVASLSPSRWAPRPARRAGEPAPQPHDGPVPPYGQSEWQPQAPPPQRHPGQAPVPAQRPSPEDSDWTQTYGSGGRAKDE